MSVRGKSRLCESITQMGFAPNRCLGFTFICGVTISAVFSMLGLNIPQRLFCILDKLSSINSYKDLKNEDDLKFNLFAPPT